MSMKPSVTVKVSSISFSKNPTLVAELRSLFPQTEVNANGERFQEETLIEFLKGAEAVILGAEPLTRKVMAALPHLKIVSKYGVGLDNVDYVAAGELGKKILYQAGVNRRSVSELTLAFMLGIARNVFVTGRQLAQHTWNKDGGFQLSHKTVGIIGCGHIGSDLVELLRPFNCQILINDIVDKSQMVKTGNIKQVSLDQLLRESDFISIHTPLTPTTHGMINDSNLKKCKSTAVIINTARGGIVDEQALYLSLKNKTIAAAASDVFVVEPLSHHQLLDLPNFFGTPHIGGNAREAVQAMGKAAIDNLRREYCP